MKTILFQGDSITDVGRNRTDDNNRGTGYATLITATLGMECPGEFRFINRGISGNRVIDLLSRVKVDMINHTPDYISILIGVNDVWHELSDKNGVDPVHFELYYDLLIQQLKEALPKVKIMILEPFVLRGSATTETEEKWELFQTGVLKNAEIARRIAQRYDLLFVPLQEKFDQAQQLAAADYWLVDGVHPTAMGHEIIKREWMKSFRGLGK